MDIPTSIAISAFREQERVTLLLDAKRVALEEALKRRIDRDIYFRETEKIREQYEDKRQKRNL